MFLLRSPGTWGEPVLKNRHFVSLSVGWLVSWCQKWPLPSGTDECGCYAPGKGGWSRREGQPPGSSEIGLVGGGARQLGNNHWGTPVDLPEPQMSRPFRHWGATLRRGLDGVDVRCRIMRGMWMMMTLRGCRSPFRRWATTCSCRT